MILKEIPYKKTAYIRILDVQADFFEEHLKECAAFCRMCGAELILAAGNEKLEDYPLYTAVLEMRGTAWVDREELACLFPVTEETVARWRTIYNDTVGKVDNSSTLESRDEKSILESGGAYFVHDNGHLLGIGWLEDTKLLAVAAVEKGMGRRVMHTMMSLTEGKSINLEVVSTNGRAIRLYEKLGFVKTAELRRWHDVSKL